MAEYKRILIIRFSSLGDVILTTPLISELRQKFLNSTIDFCTKESYSEIFKYNSSVNEVLTIPDNAGFNELRDIRKRIIENHYNLIIDLHNSIRTFYLKLLLFFKTKIITYNKRTFKKFMLVRLKVNLLRDEPPIAGRYKQTLAKLNISYDKKNIIPEVPISNLEKNYIVSILKQNSIDINKKLIVIIPASIHFTKTYPPELWTELINMIPNEYEIIIVGKGKDINVIERIKKNVNRNIISLCDKLNLTQITALMDRAFAVISGDTGPMHIAEALNKKLICLAGPSVGVLGFFPQNENAITLKNEGLYCRPCSSKGLDKCPEKHFRCMKELHPDTIHKVLFDNLDKPSFS